MAAGLAVDELRRRGVRPWFVIDEGGAVAHDAFPGIVSVNMLCIPVERNTVVQDMTPIDPDNWTSPVRTRAETPAG